MKKSLSEMTLEEMWKLFPIILSEHKSCWREWYNKEEKRIATFIGMKNIKIYHIGSTAINNIWAKPIVDILLEIPNDISMSVIKEMLLNNGYICMHEEKNRKSFNRGYTNEGFAEKVFHLHLHYYGDNDELFFRDYMNENFVLAKKYEKLKLSLWKEFKYNRDAYTNAKEALETAVEDETTTPMTFKELIEKLENKGKSLVSVVELKEVINEYETFNSELYTKVTFDGYVQAIDDGKKLLENGTTKEITDQIEAIHVKKQALVPNSDLLEDIIQDAMKVDSKNYTIDSYNKLQAAINDAQTAVENTTRDQYDVHATNITNAKTALVNITALKDMMNKVNKLDESSYTKESYQVVADMMKDTEQVIIDGNVQEVKEATTNLRQAIDKLELSGTKAWKEYVQNLKLKDSADYTVESYKEYKQAYDNLVGMNEDLSLVEFNKVKFVYEEALEALIYKTADYSKVQEILNKIPEDLSAFDAKKVEALNKIIATIDYNKKINEQKVVDQYAQNLQKALDDVLKSFNQTNKPSEDKPSIDSDVLGEEVDTTKKPTVQPKPNQPTNIKNVNGVKTGDDVMIAPYAILAMCAIGVYMTLRKRKQG